MRDPPGRSICKVGWLNEAALSGLEMAGVHPWVVGIIRHGRSYQERDRRVKESFFGGRLGKHEGPRVIIM